MNRRLTNKEPQKCEVRRVLCQHSVLRPSTVRFFLLRFLVRQSAVPLDPRPNARERLPARSSLWRALGMHAMKTIGCSVLSPLQRACSWQLPHSLWLRARRRGIRCVGLGMLWLCPLALTGDLTAAEEKELFACTFPERHACQAVEDDRRHVASAAGTSQAGGRGPGRSEQSGPRHRRRRRDVLAESW